MKKYLLSIILLLFSILSAYLAVSCLLILWKGEYAVEGLWTKQSLITVILIASTLTLAALAVGILKIITLKGNKEE